MECGATPTEIRIEDLRIQREHEKLVWKQRVDSATWTFLQGLVLASIFGLWWHLVWAPLMGGG